MAERNFSEEAREAAERLLAAYGWQLLAPDTFGVAVAALLAGAPDLAARRAALQVYAAALHRACSGDGGCARPAQGYR